MRKKILGIKGLGTLSALALGIVLLLTMVVMRSGCDCGTLFASPADKYEEARAYIQNAVTEYMVSNGGQRPFYGEMMNTSECFIQLHPAPQSGYIYAGWVLDFCYMMDSGWLYSEDLPFELPECCYGQSGEEGTNFYTGNCTNPYSGHYVWLIDEVGNVCSVCVGDDCWSNNQSGYQGVWP